MRISDWISDVCSSDLARPLDELLDEHAVVAEAGLGFVPHRLEGVAHVLFAIGKAHALAAAACRRLHHHRIADALGDFGGVVGVLDFAASSDERPVGQECVSPCIYRWAECHLKKTKNK